jgi:homoserine O-succinyltransferase
MARRAEAGEQMPTMLAAGPGQRAGHASAPTASTDCVEIGIVNNMPDAALEATERQFAALIDAAAAGRAVRLHFFSLPEIERGTAAAARLGARYGDLGALFAARLDGLIVTGCEPKASLLTDEPYWKSLADLVDWAEHNTASTIWSCLAAHAAVLHLDGVNRAPLARKCSGVFECVRAGNDPLLDGLGSVLRFPHSRWNGVGEEDLKATGYRVLTRSPQAGVDMFAKDWRSRFLFFQGHPEYDATSLLREYRRDVGRYLRGQRPTYPDMPQGYFDAKTTEALADFALRAKADPHEGLLPTLASLLPASVENGWRHSSVRIFSNWLGYLVSRRQ